MEAFSVKDAGYEIKGAEGALMTVDRQMERGALSKERYDVLQSLFSLCFPK